MAKFGLLNYQAHRNIVNIGDFIQSLAAKQFLPHVDQYADREKLSEYCGEKIKLILNGWFMSSPQNWPPSTQIEPLFVSFHINDTVRSQLTSPQSISYLKAHQPIGCRDYHTCELLKAQGVDAYFSGCLTLTLNKTIQRKPSSGEILFVDVLGEFPPLSDAFTHPKTFLKKIASGQVAGSLHKKRLLKQMFSQEILDKAIYLSSYINIERKENLFDEAYRFLDRLAAAEIVFTSRIHTALPCLAIGVPVVFIDGGLYLERDVHRLGGLIELFNTIHIDRNYKITSNFDEKLPLSLTNIPQNPSRHTPFVEELSHRVEAFINEFPKKEE